MRNFRNQCLFDRCFFFTLNVLEFTLLIHLKLQHNTTQPGSIVRRGLSRPLCLPLRPPTAALITTCGPVKLAGNPICVSTAPYTLPGSNSAASAATLISQEAVAIAPP